MPKFDWNQFPVAPQQEVGPGKFDWNAFPEAKSTAPTPEESAIRGGISAYTGGFDDEIVGGIGAAGRLVGVKNLGSWKPFQADSHLEMADKPLSGDELLKAYRENRDAIRYQQKQDLETNPKETIGANVFGSMISPLAKVAAPIGNSGKLVGAMKTGALQGAIYGAGGSEADLTKGEVGKFAGDTALGATVGAAIPPAIEGGKAVIKGGANLAAKTAGFTGRKLFSSLFGVSEENASKYLARRAEINAAPEIAQIKNQVDDAVLKLSQDVENGKIGAEEAKAAYNDLKQEIRNHLTDQKVEARIAVQKADEMLKDSAAKLIQPLKDTKAPTHLSSDVVNSIEELKANVIAKSQQALEGLKDSGKRVNLRPVYSHIDDSISKLKEYGTKEADAVAAELEAYKLKQIETHGLDTSADSAKKLIQGLDKVTTYSPMAGSFDQSKNAAFKGIRGQIDESLKEAVPTYKAQMEQLAPQVKLLEESNAGFGEERRAIGRLGQVASPKGALDRETLAKLEQTTGRQGSFTQPIDEYTRAQSLLKDKVAIDQMVKSLPEYANYRQAMAKLAKMKPEWSRTQLENALANSNEARALSMAENKLAEAQAKLEPVSSLKPGSTQSKLESFGKPRGAPIETRKTIEALEQQTGQKFIQPLEDRGVLDSFSKGHAMGSRNTLLWGTVGAVFGGIPGGAVGGTYGQLMDKYGPKMGKAILDGIGKIKESPSVETIRSLSLPDSVKSQLEDAFKYYAISKATKQAPKGEDKWAMSGANILGLDEEKASQLMSTKEGKRLLIEASDLKPGSARLQKIKDQIK